MAVPMSFNYTPEQFQKVLARFQSAIDSGKYTEKIPYDTWRKLKKLYHPKIEYISPFVKVYDVIKNIDGIDRDTIIFSCKTYDWGFGRFFYDYVVKKKETEDIMTLNSTTSACDIATKASCADGLTSKIDHETIAYAGDPYGSADAAYTIALGTKADYMGYYDSDSTTGCPNYGTTTDHTIKINGDPLTSNSVYIKDSYNGIWGTAGTAVTNISTIGDRVDTLESQMEQLINEKKKENNNMKGFNFDFGPCGNTVRLSMYGLAIQNVSGEWVSYNTATKEIMNVDIINMADGGKYIYKMPVAISEVQVGDIIVHAKVPMFVTGINNDGSFNAIDVRAGEAKCILATRSPFGFNFVTKVVNLFGNMLGTPTADQPFGNMLPFLMLSGENKDIDPMTMFFLMGQNGNASINPMMWYFLSKDNKDMDPAMMWMVMSMAGGATPGFMTQPHTCKCHQKVSDEQI